MNDPVLLTARGDPRDRRTWSGTPANLVAALEAEGRDVVTADVSCDGQAARVASVLASLAPDLPRRREFLAYAPPRHQLARRRHERARASHVGPVLHTSTVGLPHRGFGRQDSLFRDVTFAPLAQAWALPPAFRRRVDERHRELYLRCGRLFVTSRWAARDLQERYGVPPERVRVVGTGLGQPLPLTGPPEHGSGRTLYVAKVRQGHKGLALLLRAHRLARRRRPGLHLELVVPPGTVAPEDGVTVSSGLSVEELAEAYRRSALFALPASFEPWGLVFLEAMRAGLATLGPARAAYPEFAEDGRGLVVERLDERCLADALVAAHDDPDGLARTGAAAAAWVDGRFSWRATARAVLDGL